MDLLASGPKEIILGDSFRKGCSYHSIRYDFKPASVDTTKLASLSVEGEKAVSVTVPHVEGAGTTHTVYKGNTRPLQKECVLIINNKTGEIRLEKLTNAIQLKKTRAEGSSKVSQQAQRPLTPSEQLKHLKHSPKKSKKGQKKSKAPLPSISNSSSTASAQSTSQAKRSVTPTSTQSSQSALQTSKSSKKKQAS